MILSGFTYIANAQGIAGVVTNADDGSPLPGVTIIVKGTTIGTTTDFNGKYTIKTSGEDATLVFSFIGFVTTEVKVGRKSKIDLALKSESIDIDEVFAVGYKTQRKIDVTGSVSTVKVEELKTVHASNLAETIMGRTSGVFVKVQNTQPGDYSGISYNIRGFGKALLVVDGIPVSNEEFQLLDPNDIAEFNVLKDAATAAAYGARAGNGVILIKTKRGVTQAPLFSYSGSYGVQQMTMMPHAVNSSQYAQFENIAAENSGENPIWSQSEIDKFKANNDPNYPNTNWWDLTLRKSAPESQHNISVRGGTEKVKYFVSGGYFYQGGLYRSKDLKTNRYNLRTNIDIALTDKIDMGVDLSILNNSYVGPSWDMTMNEHWGIMTMLYRSRPMYPASFPDPTKLVGMGGDDPNPVSPSKIEDVGYNKWNSFTSDNKFRFSYKLPFGFSAKTLINFKRVFKDEKRKEKLGSVYWMDYDQQNVAQYHHYLDYNPYNMLKQTNTRNQEFNFQGFLSWNGEFGDHKINALGVYEYLSSDGEWYNAQRIRYQFDVDYLFAGPILDRSNDGRGYRDGRIGQILSFDYNYKEKYLLGFNVRRDGSPKFPKDTRWGVFPSISTGWRISEEDFFKSNVSFVDNLKLRASWGKLGYDATGSYQYLSTYSIVPASLMVDGVVASGINADNIPNPNITWEKMTTSNVGIDFGMFKNKLTGSFDAFYRYRSDVLGDRQVSLPDIVGASMPQQNINEYSNRGMELELNYNGKFRDISFEVGGNVSYSREKIEYIDQPSYASEEQRRRNNRIGQWSDTRWGYKTDGLFSSQEEIDNWAVIDGKGNATVNVGDIKFVDYNGDGILTSNDQVIIGRGTSPDLMFAMHGNVKYKGVSLSMLLQGAGLYDIWYGGSADISDPFMGGNAPILEMLQDSWTPDNTWGVAANKSASPVWPRYYLPSYPTMNRTREASFWYTSGTYLRLKNIELAYTLPKNMTKRFGIDNLKFYVSGYNLLTLSALNFYDPEMEKDGAHPWSWVMVYPPTKSYNLGLVLDF